MNILKRLDNNTIQLCCGGNQCPTVESINDEDVVITDDNGNKIVVKKGQAKMITDAVAELDKKDELLLG